MQKFHHGQPSWNFSTVWTNQTDIFIPRKGVENSHVIYKQSLPGTKMIDCARGFKLQKQIQQNYFFVVLYLFTNLCYALTFCISITQKKIASKRDSATSVFLWILQNFANFFIEHLLTAASETVTENRRGNSVPHGKLHIISPADVWLGSKWASAQKVILKNRMKNVKNMAMLKC